MTKFADAAARSAAAGSAPSPAAVPAAPAAPANAAHWLATFAALPKTEQDKVLQEFARAAQ